MMMPKIVVMYVITITGGTFYLSKFPENFFPGKIIALVPGSPSSAQWHNAFGGVKGHMAQKEGEPGTIIIIMLYIVCFLQ